jgi:hypothetical protein
MAQGSVAMIDEPGGSKYSWSGEPGADVMPRKAAVTRSSSPTLF